MMMRRIFDATADAVPSARHAVTAFAERQGFRGAALHDIALAVSEVCTNVVMHAYREDPEPGTFAVEARRPDDELEITVSDGGMGMAPRNDSPGLGVGLPLIATLAGTFEVHADGENGTTVVMRFARAE